MDVIEIARQLGKAIQEDERYSDYMLAKEKNDADEALQALIGEFNLIRQNLAMEESKPAEEQNPDIKFLFTVKIIFSKILCTYSVVIRQRYCNLNRIKSIGSGGCNLAVELKFFIACKCLFCGIECVGECRGNDRI